MPIGFAAGAALTQVGVAAETAAGVGLAVEGAGWAATGAAAYYGTKGEFPSSSSLRGHANKKVLAQASDVHRSATHHQMNKHNIHSGVQSSGDYNNAPIDPPRGQDFSLVDNAKREAQGHKRSGQGGHKKPRHDPSDPQRVSDEDPHFEEVNDPILHAQEMGAGMNATLNELGMSENYCVVPFEAIVESIKRDGDGDALTQDIDAESHGFFHWSASMTFLRYAKPFREFMSLYHLYRIRGFSLQFDPITLNTEYVVGQSKTTVQQVAAAGDAAAETVLHDMQMDINDLNSKAAAGTIPRVGPTVTSFVARGVDDPYSMSCDWNTDFDAMAAMDGAIVHRTSNNTLPSVLVEYVPELSDTTAGYRCPHPVTRYNSTDMEVQDECFPSLGSFYLRTSETMTAVPLYKLTAKVLVEFASIASIPYPLAIEPTVFSNTAYDAPEDEQDRRRLISVDDVSHRHNLGRHQWTSKSKFSIDENFAASSTGGNTVMNNQISTNASSINTNTQRVGALEVIVSDSEVGLQVQVADLLAIIQDMTPSAWQTVSAIGGSFSSGFSSYTTTGNSSWANEVMIRYTKYVPIVGSCVYHVHFKGMVKKGTSLMGEDQVMLNIPSFIRPTKDHFQVVNADSNTSDYHFHAVVIRVEGAGNVSMRRKLSGSDPDGAPSIKHVWLDGLSYFTDNDSANYGV